jgi:hypothetical protein
MPPDTKILSRTQLFEAAQKLGLSAQLRKVGEFGSLDDSLLYAANETKDAMVILRENATWGPQLSSYVKPADEHWDRSLLTIEVPNTLEGRTAEIMDTLRQWFAH